MLLRIAKYNNDSWRCFVFAKQRLIRHNDHLLSCDFKIKFNKKKFSESIKSKHFVFFWRVFSKPLQLRYHFVFRAFPTSSIFAFAPHFSASSSICPLHQAFMSHHARRRAHALKVKQNKTKFSVSTQLMIIDRVRRSTFFHFDTIDFFLLVDNFESFHSRDRFHNALNRREKEFEAFTSRQFFQLEMMDMNTNEEVDLVIERIIRRADLALGHGRRGSRARAHDYRLKKKTFPTKWNHLYAFASTQVRRIRN